MFHVICPWMRESVRDVSAISVLDFSKLLSLVHLGTKMNLLDFGFKSQCATSQHVQGPSMQRHAELSTVCRVLIYTLCPNKKWPLKQIAIIR